MSNGQYTGRKWIPDELAARLYGYRYLRQDGGDRLPERTDISVITPLQVKDNNADGLSEISIAPTALIPSVPVNDTAFVDGRNGNDGTGKVGEQTFSYKTIGAALDAVDAVGPSAGNPMMVEVNPGVYSETPRVVSAYVTLASKGGAGTATIVASNPSAPLITLQSGSYLTGFTVAGAAAPGGMGALVTSGSAIAIACVFVSCEKLASSNGATAELIMIGCTALGDSTVLVGVEALSGGRLYMGAGSLIRGTDGSLIAEAIRADGAGSEVFPEGLAVEYADGGMVVSNSGRVLSSGCSLRNCDKALRIAASGGTIEIGSSAITGSVTEDILIESSAGKLLATGLMHEKPANIAAGASVFGSLLNRTSEVVTQEGTLCSGSPDRPGTFSAGEGCPTVEGMHAWHYDGLTWTDVTDVLASSSGSSIDVVPGLGLGNYLYVGGNRPFTGLELDVAVAQVGGALLPEYWAAGWTAYDWMTSEAVPDYAPSGNALFATTGKQTMRDGPKPDWTTSNENSVVKYWVRFGVSSALTTSPRLKSVKLNGSSFRTGPDGTVTLHGGQSYGWLDADLGKWRVGSGTAPTAIATGYSTNVSVGSFVFTAGPTTRQFGYRFQLPLNVDTSQLVELLVEWYPSNADVNPPDLRLYYTPVPAGWTLGGLTGGEQLLTPVITPPGVAGRASTITYSMLVPGLVAGQDGVAMLLRRQGSDAFTGNMILTSAVIRYKLWR